VDAGWHLLAFTRELEAEITPARVGRRRLMLVRRGEDVQAFDAVCPHRGADLAHGGRLEDGAVVCPFHGHRIALRAGAGGFCAHGYRTLALGGSVFVLMSEAHERGFATFAERLAETHYFVQGFQLRAPVPPRYVVENVCDVDHFTTVHGIHRRPRMRSALAEGGDLRVEAVFSTDGANPWQDGAADGDGVVDTRFCAHVFSPTLVASELGDGDRAHVVFTGATAAPDGGCVIRVALAVAGDEDGPPPAPMVRQLLRDSLLAFEQDMEIWRHLTIDATPNYAPGDGPIIDYHRFCGGFAS
jgi:phenylpropionate dioxygenase-like ring-hydroxylating dioxygenase large terminal subunit